MLPLSKQLTTPPYVASHICMARYMDQLEHDQRGVPAPGECQPDFGFSSLQDGGGRISSSSSQTFIEKAEKHGRSTPGPGKYHTMGTAIAPTHNAKQKQQQQHYAHTATKRTSAGSTGRRGVPTGGA